MTRRIFLLFPAVLMLAFMPLSQARAAELAKPDWIAVYFYADWCPKCKVLSPKFQEARKQGGLDDKNILFVKLDLTDKTRIHQSVMLAQTLGIGDYLKAQGSATGYVAILDAKTGQEKLRFNSSASVQDIIDTASSLRG